MSEAINLDNVLALARAGYSRDEISALLTAQPASESAPAPVPAPDPEPQPAPAPQPDPAPAQPDGIQQRLDQVLEELRAAAIRQTVQPHQETPDEILAQIIRPKRREDNGNS